ncbi:MAG TPA: asparagine synthase (glutamine-hydrolyzing) [Candidatus Marinimicrobia bacterium]|nr:asparagine synthase (glutamine-hydrolyzing) [Candidatus Neomarinimicrobiota bacterium]
MCGICGIYHHGKIEVSPAEICRMRDFMIERGPDSSGYELLPEIALGHRRLKIIDLSDAATQPMTNADRSIWTVFNGAIYNYRELRQELLAVGYHFKSNSDTEVLLQGYAEWGTDLFQKITGMFAIAIYDSQKKQLILARDRVGKKPLYFTEQSGIVYFASDIKAVVAVLPAQPPVSLTALDCYLHHIAIPDQHTIFEGIQKVQPGSYHVFSENGQVVTTYWEWNYAHKVVNDEPIILQNCEQLLIQAVLRRTVGDVPIGTMLSGGVDSSIITAILCRNSTQRIKTFTMGFKNYPMEDILAAREVAKLYDTEHTELILDHDVTENLLELVWQFGEPFADSSAIPTYLISRAARQYITVMLTGDGGDEAFGGYGRTIVPRNAQIFSQIIPPFLHPLVGGILKGIGVNPESNSIIGKILFYINYLKGFPYKSFYNTMGFYKYRNSLWNPEYLSKIAGHNPLHPFHENFRKVSDLDPIDQVLFTDGMTRLVYDYLVKIDRATMANSIECRSPFLDTALLEYVAKIPPKMKFKNHQTKYLLKKIAEKYLPHKLIYTEKRGFGVPVDRWIQNDLSGIFETVVFNRYAQKRNYFNYDFINKIWNDQRINVQNHKHRLWALFWLELWHLMFIDKIISRDMPLREVERILK